MEQMEQTPPAPKVFNSKEDRGKALRQVVAAFIANLGTINTGLVFGFSAVVIPQLKREDSIIPIDESQASWIGKCKHSIKDMQRLSTSSNGINHVLSLESDYMNWA